MSAGRTQLASILGIIFFLIICSTGACGGTEELKGNSLTLKECVVIGLRQNPSAEISMQNLKAAKEKIGEAQGGYYPSLKLSSSSLLSKII